MSHFKSPASPTITKLGFRDVDKSRRTRSSDAVLLPHRGVIPKGGYVSQRSGTARVKFCRAFGDFPLPHRGPPYATLFTETTKTQRRVIV